MQRHRHRPCRRFPETATTARIGTAFPIAPCPEHPWCCAPFWGCGVVSVVVPSWVNDLMLVVVGERFLQADE
ncbi:hypothetical protein ACIOWI_37540, partial [Streptomyces sp. NPDC087659]|uniref:hypothetical protein n=1 Tax=Streptomyces sp. NPDC087659 TaxID=3365801 RepID=UPI00381097E9